MGCLAQQPDGLDLLAVAGQRLELQGELGVELAAGQDGALIAGLSRCRGSARLGMQGGAGVLGLLRLLLLVLAGAGGRIHPGARRRGGPDLGCVVGL